MAASAGFKAHQPRKVGQEAARLVAGLRNPGGLLVFVGGSLATQLTEVAQAVASACPGVPAMVASGAWVFHEDGEIEDDSAGVVLAWSGKAATLLAVDADDPARLGSELSRALQSETALDASAIFLLCDSERFTPDLLTPLASLADPTRLFGGGTIGTPGVIAVAADGTAATGGAVAMLLHGLTPPIVGVSPACRLLTPFLPITEHDEGIVLKLADEAALDVLTAAGEQLEGQPLIFAALIDEDPGDDERPHVLLRPIRGVDPSRRGLFVTDELRPGTRMAIAARDAAAARDDLAAMARQVRRSTAGAALRFGIYVNCAGRGSSLYGTYDVDIRGLRSIFPDMPIVGMSSAFEIAPHGDEPRMHLYTGVLAVFTAPS
jgi:small ligand-binding sensory domain FIST